MQNIKEEKKLRLNYRKKVKKKKLIKIETEWGEQKSQDGIKLFFSIRASQTKPMPKSGPALSLSYRSQQRLKSR